MTDIRKSVEYYYDTNIEPLFDGYVNDKHKNDCVEGILVLYDALKEDKITYEQWKSDIDVQDDICEFFGKTPLSKGIPLYLEEITGDHSNVILEERQDDLIKFLVELL